MEQHIAERFWANVDSSAGPEECWPWIASRAISGHGRFGSGIDKIWSSHRWLMAKLANEKLERSDFVCHKCDNPPCCNPSHLYIGSAQDNIRDRESRGRSGSGRVNAVKTHCPRGHLYDEKNTLMKNGSRNCRACHAAREVRRRSLKRGGRHR